MSSSKVLFFVTLIFGEGHDLLLQASEDISDYGFPRCYTSFPNYETNWVDDTPHEEVRPLIGQKRYPYQISTVAECSGDDSSVQPPLIGLGPHWSPLGLTVYRPGSLDDSQSLNLPEIFHDRLIVASHGSWNRDPWIGYNVVSYSVDVSGGTYSVSEQARLLPPLRYKKGDRIRAVDVRMSPVGDGALLMTADRDDLVLNNRRGGGLYRIVGGSDGNSTEAGSTTRIPIESTFDMTPPDGVALDRLASISCARQLTHSTLNPNLVFISTFSKFCPDRRKTAGTSIFVVELESTETIVKHGPIAVINKLNGPQGIDYHDGNLYIATDGNSMSNRGNCVLQVLGIDDLALSILNGTRSTLNGASDDEFVKVINCNFTRVQQKHSWRSIRVHPTGDFGIISVGADCNWSETCTHSSDVMDKELQTTLIRMELGTSPSKGNVSIAATGIRNAIGLYFDENANLLFTSFGSDRAWGIPGGNFNNVPDCAVEVLKLLKNSDYLLDVCTDKKKKYKTFPDKKTKKCINLAKADENEILTVCKESNSNAAKKCPEEICNNQCQCGDDFSESFTLVKKNKAKVNTCKWLSKKSSKSRKRMCKKNDSDAKTVCPWTCANYCSSEE